MPRAAATLIKEGLDFKKGGGAKVTFEASFVEVLHVGEPNKKGVWVGDEVFNELLSGERALKLKQWTGCSVPGHPAPGHPFSLRTAAQ